MSRVIYKYSFEPKSGERPVLVGGGFTFLSVGVQNGYVVIWGEVEPMAPLSAKKLVMVETGKEVPERTGRFSPSYKGTVQFTDFVTSEGVERRISSPYVLHIYIGE